MKHNDELEQRLWELEYGLLSESEADELREQIASDLELAAIHERVREQCGLVAKAARIQVPPILLQTAEKDGHGLVAVKPPKKPSKNFRRLFNIILASAATLLVGMLGFALTRVHAPLAQTVANADFATFKAPPQEDVKIAVVGPAKIHPSATKAYSFRTTDREGQPQPATLDVKLQNTEGLVRRVESVTTDERGRGYIAFDDQLTGDVAKLTVQARGDESAPVELPLLLTGDSYRTHLRTDLPWYFPGDVMRWRSVSLSHYGLEANRELAVQYEVTDPSGKPLATAAAEGVTQHGVGSGEVVIDPNAPAGTYTVTASSPERLFPRSSRLIYVQDVVADRWNVAVTWDKERFRAGETAVAKISVRSPDGQPAADLLLKNEVIVDGHQVPLEQSETKTDSTGTTSLSVTLPNEIAYGEALIHVSPAGEEAVIEQIPIESPRVVVDFYPEGGELVAGVPSRVYFFSHDALDRPLPIEGEIVDSSSKTVATLKSQAEGRGVFELTPRESESYSLKISNPSGVASDSTLPPALDQPGVVLNSGTGIFRATEPVQVELRTNGEPRETIVAVYCRNVLVGQSLVVPDDFQDGRCPVSIPVPAEAAGVLRVTVLQEGEPQAERLVYRTAERKLNLAIEGLKDRYEPGESVELEIVVRDEHNAAVPAALGIGVVDGAVAKLSKKTQPHLTTHFWFLGDVESPEKLENANFYLKDEPEAAVALDLLLGTQGWRRFQRTSASGFAAAGQTDQYLMGRRDSGAVESLGFGMNVTDGQSDASQFNFDAAEMPARVDNSAAFGVSNDESPQLSAIELQQAITTAETVRPSRIWMILAAAAAAMLMLCGIALLLPRIASRYVAFGGVVVASLVLLIAVLNSPPQVESVGAIAANETQTTSSSVVLSDQLAAEPKDAPTEKAEVLYDDLSRPLAEVEKRDLRFTDTAKFGASAEAFGEGVNAERQKVTEPEPAGGLGGVGPAPAQRAARKAAQPASEELDRGAGIASGADRPYAVEKAAAAPKEAPLPKATQPKEVAERVADEPHPASAPGVPPPPAPAEPATAPAAAPATPMAAGLEAASKPATASRMMRIEGENSSRARMPIDRKSNANAEFTEGKDARVGTRLEPFLQKEKKVLDQVRMRGAGATANQPTDGSEKSNTSVKQLGDNGGDADKKPLEKAVDRENLGSRPLDSLSAGRFFYRQYAHSRARDTEGRRTDFTPTVYWNPLAVADENGRVRIKFDLSQSASNFLIFVDAHHGGRLGSIEKEIVVGR